MDDSEGITFYSLGGVFISTGVGLVIAMLVLVGEVMYYRKQDAKSSLSSARVTPESRIIKVNQKQIKLAF